MSTQKPTKEKIVAIGEDGDAIPLTTIGYDELSGIYFYKLSGKIVTPVNLAGQAPRIGSSFLAVSRQNDTAKISVQNGIISANILPGEQGAPGVQSLGQLQSTNTLSSGSALLDEEGNLVGALLSAEEKTALLISDIRLALERLSANKFTYNPFTTLGITLSWKAQLDENKKTHIRSVVTQVENSGQAQVAGLQVGDTVTAIGGSAVSWDTNIIKLLDTKPLSLAIVRKGEQRTISFNP